MNSTHHMQREQMSISSITSNQQRHHYLPRFSNEPCHHPCSKEIDSTAYYYHPKMVPSPQHHIRSPPTSPEQDQFINSPPSSPHSYSSYRGEEEDASTTTTATLQERRQRNKAASAKYRQKKNVQQHEMRNMIHQITERNSLLERQLKEVHEENQKLRATADKLRGKFVAKKLLRQWMDRHQRLPLPIPSGSRLDDIDLLDDDDDDDLSSSDL
jgi:septin family protein